MDSKAFFKYPESIENKANHWYLVQYEINPQKFVRKIAQAHEIIWIESSHIKNEQHQQQQHQQMLEHILIRDQDQLFLGYIVYKALNEQDARDLQKFLQLITIQLLHSTKDFKDIVDKIDFNHNFWLLIMYSISPTTTTSINLSIYGDHSVFGIFHKNDVILKNENQTNNIFAYVQEQMSTYKGVVIKITNDLSELILAMDVIKNDVVKTFKGNTILGNEKKSQKVFNDLRQMEQRMFKESKLLLHALETVDKSKFKIGQRLLYLKSLAKFNNIQIIDNTENNLNN